MKRYEILLATALTCICLSIVVWSFWSREVHGPRPLIAGPDAVKTSRLVIVDSEGTERITITGTTLEVIDSRGRKQTVDLSKLVSRANLFGE